MGAHFGCDSVSLHRSRPRPVVLAARWDGYSWPLSASPRAWRYVRRYQPAQERPRRRNHLVGTCATGAASMTTPTWVVVPSSRCDDYDLGSRRWQTRPIRRRRTLRYSTPTRLLADGYASASTWARASSVCRQVSATSWPLCTMWSRKKSMCVWLSWNCCGVSTLENTGIPESS